MGGVTLTFPGSEGISASEIVFDEVTGLAAIMKLFERDKDESVATHVLRAPMMALRQPGAALAYPQDTVLNPRLFLRNAGATNLQVSLAVDWRSGNSTGTYKYPAFSLRSNDCVLLISVCYRTAAPFLRTPTGVMSRSRTLGRAPTSCLSP